MKPHPDEDAKSTLRVLVSVVDHKCAYLLIALFLLLFSYPYLADTPAGDVTLVLMNATILVAATYATSRSRFPLLVAVALAIAGIGLLALHLLTASRTAYILLGIAIAVFYAFVTIDLLAYVLRRGVVSPDKLFAAVSGYILIALFWGTLYGIVYELQPNAFLSDISNGNSTPLDFYDFLYVSFGALTSAGFEGIAPANHEARSLLSIEKITGVFYIAILIARLTGIYPPQRPGG